MTSFTETPDERPADGVRREIEVASPPGEVWDLLVDDEERSAWFGGATTLDAEPGGEGTFEDPDGHRRSASVVEADPGRRLVWTWWPDDDSGASRVEIDLVPLPGGTRISVTETPLTTAARASALTTSHGPLLDLELRVLVAGRVPVAIAGG